ncbi:uncharacterized protein, partial [Notothenia coriiceps]|uniref:Endonuclease domain-containing 1 protein-like n=1 Tax=Notothenia coriiceps TaxID=8208 RepID=A0A6I9PJS9_9TELE
MAHCPWFLLEEKTPNVPDVLQDGTILDQNRYKVICQTFKNKRRFVTLYDTRNKIPVFSAFKYRGTDGTKSNRPLWRMEPQLERKTNAINMRNDKKRNQKKNQASNSDYLFSDPYNRGHLFPNSYGFDKEDRDSTFTLTNIVPQVKNFNGGSWAEMERCVQCFLNKHCINSFNLLEGFVVTGAKPGNTQLKERVNIPSLLWSAFCCYNHTKDKWLAAAYWGDNVPGEHSRNLEPKTLAELHEQLGFEVFPGTQCPLREHALQEEQSRRRRRGISASSSFCPCLPQTSTTSAPPTTTPSFPSSTVSTTLSTTLSTTTDKTTTVPITPATTKPQTYTTNPLTTIPATSEPQYNSIIMTSTPTIPASSEPKTNSTNQTSTAFIPASTESQTNQTPTIPATSEPQINSTSSTSTPTIPATSE